MATLTINGRSERIVGDTAPLYHDENDIGTANIER